MCIRKLASVFFLLFCSVSVFAQDFNQTVSLHSLISGDNPFWLQTNNFGKFDTEGVGLVLESDSKYKIKFDNGLSIHSNMVFTARWADRSALYFPILNSSFKYGKVELQVGRFYNGEKYERLDQLSSGNLTMSKNAVPIPRILVNTEYISVPFTRDYLQIRGTFGHGILDGNRAVYRPYLHESSLYGKLGTQKLNIYAGLNRYAFWGGTSNNPAIGALPSSFNDFLRIVFSRKGGEDAPELDQDYRLGDQFGNYKSGITWNGDTFLLKGYWQNFFEDKDGLILKNYKDGLFGIFIESAGKQLFRSFVMEHIYSKNQSGPHPPDGTRGGPGGQDNYYNHSVYLTGWSYYGRSVGTPFFTSDGNGGVNSSYFTNNRISVNHVGFGGYINTDLQYHVKLSRSNNHGNYKNRDYFESQGLEYEFTPPKEQYSLFLEFDYDAKENGNFSARIAYDNGELYPNSLGLILGYTYKLND